MSVAICSAEDSLEKSGRNRLWQSVPASVVDSRPPARPQQPFAAVAGQQFVEDNGRDRTVGKDWCNKAVGVRYGPPSRLAANVEDKAVDRAAVADRLSDGGPYRLDTLVAVSALPPDGDKLAVRDNRHGGAPSRGGRKCNFELESIAVSACLVRMNWKYRPDIAALMTVHSLPGRRSGMPLPACFVEVESSVFV